MSLHPSKPPNPRGVGTCTSSSPVSDLFAKFLFLQKTTKQNKILRIYGRKHFRKSPSCLRRPITDLRNSTVNSTTLGLGLLEDGLVDGDDGGDESRGHVGYGLCKVRRTGRGQDGTRECGESQPCTIKNTDLGKG